MNRCAACALAGTALCLHLVALETFDAAHVNQPEAKPAVMAGVPPLRLDENPREYDHVARIIDVNIGATTSSGVIITPRTGSLRFEPPATSSPSWLSMGPLVARTPSA